MSTLKMIFNLDNQKTTTFSLADPKTGLTADEIRGVADDIVARKAFVVNDAFPASLKRAYIQDTSVQNLVTEADV